MKTITTQNEPDLDLKNRFFRDNLRAMAETKMLQTAKQEAENRLVERITGVKVEAKLESAYQTLMQDR